MAFPTIEIADVGDDYRVYIDFSETEKITFGDVIGYEGNAGGSTIRFWGNEWNTFLEITKEANWTYVLFSVRHHIVEFRVSNIEQESWNAFYQAILEENIPHMTEAQWSARFQEDAVHEEPDEEDPRVPDGGRRKKTRARKIKRRKTYRKGIRSSRTKILQ